MPLTPAAAACRAISTAIGGFIPTPVRTGTRPFASSMAVFATARCSAGESEWNSPVPAGATTAHTGCLRRTRRLCRSPSRSSERSCLKGVQGNEITPLSLLRSSVGCISRWDSQWSPPNQAEVPDLAGARLCQGKRASRSNVNDQASNPEDCRILAGGNTPGGTLTNTTRPEGAPENVVHRRRISICADIHPNSALGLKGFYKTCSMFDVSKWVRGEGSPIFRAIWFASCLNIFQQNGL